MRTYTAIMLNFVVAGLAQFCLPWWVLSIVCFGTGVWLPSSPHKAFGAGLVGIGVLWGGLAGYWHWYGQGVMTARMAEMLSIPSAWLLIVLTALLGGCIGGFASLAGFYLRAIHRTKPAAKTV